VIHRESYAVWTLLLEAISRCNSFKKEREENNVHHLVPFLVFVVDIMVDIMLELAQQETPPNNKNPAPTCMHLHSWPGSHHERFNPKML
jgi:hypothetical protein